MDSSKEVIHPAWLRLAHWLNALAVLVLVTSGWKIYNATAFLGFTFPKVVTLGGWLGGALLWHFAAMWVLAINGTAYLLLNGVTKRLATKFFPLSFKPLVDDITAALKGHLAHTDPRQYNTVQRLAYLFVMLDSVLLVLSGLVLWKSVQFPLLRTLLDGHEGARLVHFAAMSALVFFVVVHLAMVMLVPRTLITMVRGH
ncbi:cytochrome b/b6 domain-containing protein [Rhodoferax sp.]|uniref:cytochrome b/b6 domain-containing protein n=1 Tax=Rhodoferax sp. TaxID=50421 RepID=UPI0025EE4FF1|nr:cytochrome b/b6 domain-containing protein [Rhodoferax sp.]MCM2340016.1 cytochrome b/b6 domain-containing protein [Rhodoferax sp.]